jgi:uncharacterized surface protein with fasciclin (FAS1) repeats
MKKVQKYTKLPFFLSLTLLVVLFTIMSPSCKKDMEGKTYTTATGTLISAYLKAHPDSFSQFYRILEITKCEGFLDAYGLYTCFVPMNSAINDYIVNVLGKNSLDDFTTAEDTATLRSLVKYHLVADTLSTSEFVDGPLPDTTMSGDVITTSISIGGINNIIVNKSATIVKRDMRFENGIIHVINKVLNPIVDDLVDALAKDSKYTIFTKLLTETGLVDSLKVKTYINSSGAIKPFKVTAFVESDSVFAANGYGSYEALYNKLCNTKRPYKNTSDSLYLFVAYHLLGQQMYLSDFVDQGDYATFNPYGRVSITKTFSFIINEGDESGFEVTVNPLSSNNTVTNGAFHLLNRILFKGAAKPTAKYWHLRDDLYPEMARIQGKARKNIPNDTVPGIRVSPGSSWEYTVKTKYVDKDGILIQSPGTTATSAPSPYSFWVEFDLPQLVEGTYNIWACYRTDGTNRSDCDVFWDGEPLGVARTSYMWPIKNDNPVNLLAANFKYYAETSDGSSLITDGQLMGYLVGSVTVVDPLATHVIRFVLKDLNKKYLTLDMIQAIPVGMDQTSTTFKVQ